MFIENPTYFLAITMLKEHGFYDNRIIPIPVDDKGIIVDELEKQIKKLPERKESDCRFPYMLYLVPTYSNPTGSVLSHQRRNMLANLARKYDILVRFIDNYLGCL